MDGSSEHSKLTISQGYLFVLFLLYLIVSKEGLCLWWGKIGRMVVRFRGNVGVWREILEFKGILYIKTQQIVGKLAGFEQNEHFFPDPIVL